MSTDATKPRVFVMRQSDIAACRFAILVPEHYRDDGTCKCNDADHRKKMIAEWGYTEASFDGIPLREETA